MPATPSPLGCRLHDWTVASRDAVYPRSSFRGVIMDLDDTLYPREEFVQSGLMAVARHVHDRFGIPAMEAFAAMNEARRGGHAGQEFQVLCGRYGLDGACIGELVEHVRNHRPILRLSRETASVLVHLRATGWRIVVLTNGLPHMQRNKVAALGLPALVDGVVYADEVIEGGKPHARAFAAALERLALPAGDCICVGDDLVNDIAGAHALGISAVWVATHTAKAATGREGDRVQSLTELLEVLPRLWHMGKRNAA